MIINNRQYLRLKHKHNLDLFLLDRFVGFDNYNDKLRKYNFSDNDLLFLYSKIKNDDFLSRLVYVIERKVDSKIKLGIWEED